MTNENQSTDSCDNPTQPSFGAKFKAAREALGLKHKDVAIQLRLPERIIVMLEKDDNLNDLPPTFLRGYIRAYGKFLQIADQDIAAMIATIKLPPATAASSIATRSLEPVTSDQYFMQIFSYVIVFTIFGLFGIWAYTRYTQPVQAAIEPARLVASAIPPTINPTPPVLKPVAPSPAATPIQPVPVVANVTPIEEKPIPTLEKEAKTVNVSNNTKEKIKSAPTDPTDDEDAYDDEADLPDPIND